MTKQDIPTPGPIAGAAQAPVAETTTEQSQIEQPNVNVGSDSESVSGEQQSVTDEQSNNQETDNSAEQSPVSSSSATDEEKTTEQSSEKPSTDTSAGITDTVEELKVIADKGFHYSGITDTLDTYIEVMNGRRLSYQAGAAQQKILLNVFRNLLRVGDEVFPKLLQAVLLRINENSEVDKCFGEMKRAAYLIDPASTSKKPSATFTNRDDYQFFNNMMTLLCNIADPKGRRDVLNRINVTAVFAPVQKDKSLTHGINRFVEYLHEQR